MKKWKCTVCGYVHTGDEPPETCPVCGADRSKFIEIEEDVTEEVPAAASTTEAPAEPEPVAAPPKNKLLDFAESQMLKHHAHPIMAHIPNGVLPVSVIFVFLAVFLSFQGLRLAAFYNMIVVAAAMPMVIYTGINEWKRRYGGNRTALFTAKLICGGIVLVGSAAIVIWGALAQGTLLLDSQHKWTFIGLHIVTLVAAGIAGFLGGKLVFKD
jgi:rubredoxin